MSVSYELYIWYPNSDRIVTSENSYGTNTPLNYAGKEMEAKFTAEEQKKIEKMKTDLKPQLDAMKSGSFRATLYLEEFDKKDAEYIISTKEERDALIAPIIKEYEGYQKSEITDSMAKELQKVFAKKGYDTTDAVWRVGGALYGDDNKVSAYYVYTEKMEVQVEGEAGYYTIELRTAVSVDKKGTIASNQEIAVDPNPCDKSLLDNTGYMNIMPKKELDSKVWELIKDEYVEKDVSKDPLLSKDDFGGFVDSEFGIAMHNEPFIFLGWQEKDLPDHTTPVQQSYWKF